MPITTINEVLFMGATYEQFADATGYSTTAGNFRPGTVRMAIQGPLTIALPRKIAYPEILCINFSIVMPPGQTTGWRGLPLITLTEDDIPRHKLVMWDNDYAVTTDATTGGRMHCIPINGQGRDVDKFGRDPIADGIDYIYGSAPDIGYNVFNSPDNRLHPGTLYRRTYYVSWDMNVVGDNWFSATLYKWGWAGDGGSMSLGGVEDTYVLGGGDNPSVGINGIILGQLSPDGVSDGALWSEIIVTAESQTPSHFTHGGQSLYLIELPPDGAGSIDVHGFDGGSIDPQNVTTSDWTGTYDRLDDIAPNLGFSGSDSIQTSTAGSAVGYTVTDPPHPYGVATDNGHPGEPWTQGYAGVEDGYTWTWEPYGVMVGAVGQTESTGEFSSTPSGPDHLQVGVRSGEAQEFSTPPLEMPTYSPGTPFIYGAVAHIWEDNPATGLPWTIEEINALTVAVRAS